MYLGLLTPVVCCLITLWEAQVFFWWDPDWSSVWHLRIRGRGLKSTCIGYNRVITLLHSPRRSSYAFKHVEDFLLQGNRLGPNSGNLPRPQVIPLPPPLHSDLSSLYKFCWRFKWISEHCLCSLIGYQQFILCLTMICIGEYWIKPFPSKSWPSFCAWFSAIWCHELKTS
jgi:hypothetical protein